MDRFKETDARPAAFDELGHSLQQVRKAVDLLSFKGKKGKTVGRLSRVCYLFLTGY